MRVVPNHQVQNLNQESLPSAEHHQRTSAIMGLLKRIPKEAYEIDPFPITEEPIACFCPPDETRNFKTLKTPERKD